MAGPMRGPRGVKPKVKNPGKVFKRLLSYIFRKYKWQYLLVMVLIFIGVLASVQGTLFQKDLIDVYIMPMIGAKNPDFGSLLKAMARVAVFYGIGVVTTYSYNLIMVYVTQGVLRDMRNDLFEHMEKLPIRYFDTHSHGDIMSVYTNDIDTLRQVVGNSIPSVVDCGVTIISVFVSMIFLSVPLTLVTLVMTGISLYATKVATGRSGKYYKEQQKNLGKENGFIEEMINGQKIVKVFCHEEDNKAQFKELNDTLCQSADRANTFGNMVGPINAQLGNVSYVVSAVTGGYLHLMGLVDLPLVVWQVS